jgi:Cu2+-exporting ATPase
MADSIIIKSEPRGTTCPLPPLAFEDATGARPSDCIHCGTPLGSGSEDGFCCHGCRAVHALLREQGLERYYNLRGGRGTPVTAPRPEARDLKWLEVFEAQLATASGLATLRFDLQGIQCAACVWLLEALFERRPGAGRVVVNPALGTIELTVAPAFPLRDYVLEVERFGYLFGPPLKHSDGHANILLTRIGLCVAISMNAMIFTLPIYLGLREGRVFQLFRWVSFGLTVAGVLVGGSVFLRSAWQGLRRGVLHLDVPIALGIVLAFSASAYNFFTRNDGASYFDTVNVFITLMLVGRWLQERMIERNRRFLLAADGTDGLLTRRVREGAVELVKCGEIRAGDQLLVAPGDLVPVDAALEDPRASCSLDWIHGESAPREFARGEVVPAGAFNVGTRAVTLRATTEFEASALVGLLRSTVDRSGEAARATPWWQRLSRTYVIAVLLAAAGGFGLWMIRTGDTRRAIEVATAILVVTCPCAFGIATPLAYELTQAGLRRAGLFVRTAGFLDRALSVRRVVFDKTGTLTTGVLAVTDPAALAALDPEAREALYNIVVRSNHPKSVAIRRALETRSSKAPTPRFVEGLSVEEEAGRGLELSHGGRTWRLGARDWAARGADAEHADVVFAVDGRLLAAVRTAEVVREDARAEIARLAEQGYDVWILSGDAPERVAAMASVLGVPADRAVGGQSPEGKAAWLRAHDRGDTLMVGDGINDALAVERAYCSGTPAIDRPFMPARTDFYFVTPGLRPIGLALRAARGLARVNRRNLGVALAYNAVTVGLSYAGLMSPLLCAAVMPLSSLSILLATAASLSGRSSLWRY